MKRKMNQYTMWTASAACADAASCHAPFAADHIIILGTVMLVPVFSAVMVRLPLLGVGILVWLALILVYVLSRKAPKACEPCE